MFLKRLLIIPAFLVCILNLSSHAQEPPGWHHLDPEQDKVMGVSTYRSYELLKGKKPDTVIVAILDNGAEVTHQDLKEVIWINPNEISGNKIDDDNNGYIDDIHGWNFLGNAKGQNLKNETTGLTRTYAQLHKKYKKQDSNTVTNKEGYLKYLVVKEEFELKFESKKEDLESLQEMIKSYKQADKIICRELNSKHYTITEVNELKSNKKKVKIAKQTLFTFNEHRITQEKLASEYEHINNQLETRLNPKYKGRKKLVGDNPDDINDTIYGNNQVNARGPYHGTGIASIVGAAHNDIGIDGIAAPVKLMILRIVPNGDVRDKDIALAIRYAIRNGASIINCSFAKKHPMHNDFVQDAIEEAEQAGVLIVHAAGNDGINLDEMPYYPTGIKMNGKKATNWITVGASREIDGQQTPAFFSNYGKKSVDVFAPGVNISTCTLNNGYGKGSGTSSAAPIVAGIAAVLKAYYPHLSGVQLKEIILQSVYIPKTEKVYLPGSKNKNFTTFNQLCVSGGVANLFNAISLLESGYLK